MIMVVRVKFLRKIIKIVLRMSLLKSTLISGVHRVLPTISNKCSLIGNLIDNLLPEVSKDLTRV